MPTCIYCSKAFNDSQALGNHMRTHLDDSDEDDKEILIPSKTSYDTTTSNKSIFIEKNACKRICIEQKTSSSNVDEVIDNDDEQIYFPAQSQDENDDDDIVNFSNDESIAESSDETDKESVVSDLSYITNIDADEYNEYDALFSGLPSDPESIHHEFPSEEYAEFMHMITQFHVQDTLANAFIKFFNKYSNRSDKPLPSTSQSGRKFVEDLQLPSFSWHKEMILKYKGIEYNFEYRTVLDGIRQILMNKDITKDFIFESTKYVNIIC